MSIKIEIKKKEKIKKREGIIRFGIDSIFLNSMLQMSHGCIYHCGESQERIHDAYLHILSFYSSSNNIFKLSNIFISVISHPTHWSYSLITRKEKNDN